MRKLLSIMMTFFLISMMIYPAKAEGNVINVSNYKELSAALQRNDQDVEVVLNSDITMTSGEQLKVWYNKGTVRLNLNGYSIKREGTPWDHMIKLYDNTADTQKLIVYGGTIQDTENNSNAMFDNQGELTIQSGTYIGKSICVLNESDNSVFNFIGGTLKTTSEYTTIDGKENGSPLATIKSMKDSVVNISGEARVESNAQAIYLLGAACNVRDNAYIQGQFGGVYLGTNETTKTPSTLNMTGGTIKAIKAFALAGNNLNSSGSSAEISGGVIESEATGECATIYWPFEGTLTLSGDVVVKGKTGIEIRMGKLNISGDVEVYGNGETSADVPQNGSSQSEGSAILVTTGMYGNNTDQYEKSPSLTLKIDGGHFSSVNNNAITIYDAKTSNYAQKTTVSINNGTFVSEEKEGIYFPEDEISNSDLSIKGGSFDVVDNNNIARYISKDVKNQLEVQSSKGNTLILAADSQSANAYIAEISDIQKIAVTKGDVQLTNIPEGVEVENNGSDTISVNGVSIEAGSKTVVLPATSDRPTRPTYRPSDKDEDLPKTTAECQKEFGKDYIYSDEYGACIIKYMIVDTSVIK